MQGRIRPRAHPQGGLARELPQVRGTPASSPPPGPRRYLAVLDWRVACIEGLLAFGSCQATPLPAVVAAFPPTQPPVDRELPRPPLPCSFHGIFPSKRSQEKKQRKVEEELKRKRAATGEVEGRSLERMKELQKRNATAFLPLEGNVKPGQSRDARGASHVAGADLDDADVIAGTDSTAPTLGGIATTTPLLGNAKVEAMLGLARSNQR